MPFQAVIFDLDGTLLNTIDDLAECMNHVLAGHQLPVHPIESYKIFVGDGIENLVKRALGAHNYSSDFLAECVNEMKDFYRLHWADQTAPYPGIPELLEWIEDRRIPMAVLSNKPHDAVVPVIDRFFPEVGFDRLVGEKPGEPRKPSPQGALQIARELDVDPARVLYLGDTATDMNTASAAGMFALGVTWGFRSAQELIDSGARALISRPLDARYFLAGGAHL